MSNFSLITLLKHKVKAHTLLYSLLICLLFFLTLSFYVVAGLYNKLEVIDLVNSERARLNCLSGLEILKGPVVFNGSEEISLFDEKDDIVKLTSKQWGIYKVVSSSSVVHGCKEKKMTLIGAVRGNTGSYAFFLENNHKPLLVSGQVNLSGNIFLPDPVIRESPDVYKNTTLRKVINGNILKSGTSLPAVDFDGLDIFLSDNSNCSALNYKSISNDTLINSFDAPTVKISESSPLIINSTLISGNVVVESSHSIVILSSARIDGAVFCAPKITIEKGFKGNLQCIAEDSIIVDENVVLNYPSALVIYRKNVISKPQLLSIGKNDTIQGDIILHTDLKNSQNSNMINVSDSSFIYGRIFCEGTIEIHGTLVGSLITRNSIYNSSSYYENCLVNVTIDNLSVSPDYMGGIFLSDEKKYGIVKTLR